MFLDLLFSPFNVLATNLLIFNIFPLFAKWLSQKWTGNYLCATQAKLETILATLHKFP